MNTIDDSDWASLFAQIESPKLVARPAPQEVVENLKHAPDFKPGEPFEHPCYCGKPGIFSIGVSFRNDKLGTWYCGDHRPIPKV